VVRVFRWIACPGESRSTGRCDQTATSANTPVFKQLALGHLRLVPEQSGRQIATLLVCLALSPVTLMAVAHPDIARRCFPVNYRESIWTAGVIVLFASDRAVSVLLSRGIS
jgi:hypothetical protein